MVNEPSVFELLRFDCIYNYLGKVSAHSRFQVPKKRRDEGLIARHGRNAITDIPAYKKKKKKKISAREEPLTNYQQKQLLGVLNYFCALDSEAVQNYKYVFSPCRVLCLNSKTQTNKSQNFSETKLMAK